MQAVQEPYISKRGQEDPYTVQVPEVPGRNGGDEMINPDEAPEGFRAVKATMLCGGCKFHKKNRCMTQQDKFFLGLVEREYLDKEPTEYEVAAKEIICSASGRKDGEMVIFKKKDGEG